MMMMTMLMKKKRKMSNVRKMFWQIVECLKKGPTNTL